MLSLYMDGTAYIKLASMTFNRLVMDVKIPRKIDATRTYFDFRTGFSFGYLQSLANGTDTEGNDGAMQTFINGIGPKTNNTAMVPDDVRCSIDVRWATAATDDVNIFSNSNNGGTLQTGIIYDIKFYNGATLVAHYDMSTGTMTDQTGNGNVATLTNGQWVDDGSGSPSVEHTASGASANVSTGSGSAIRGLQASGASTAGTSSFGAVVRALTGSGTGTTESRATAAAVKGHIASGSAVNGTTAQASASSAGAYLASGSSVSVSTASGAATRAVRATGAAESASGASGQALRALRALGAGISRSASSATVVRHLWVSGASEAVSTAIGDASLVDPNSYKRRISFRVELTRSRSFSVGIVRRKRYDIRW